MLLGNKGPLSMELATSGIWEKIETQFIMRDIKKGTIVLDIGANIGYYTLILAKLVGKKGKVFAFEPEPENFQLLKKNIEINGYQNVICENIAISNQNGEIDLYFSERSIGQHKIYQSSMVSENSIRVKSITLDQYFGDLDMKDKISFIKIDTEGAEYCVINGMKSLLGSNKKLKIMLEFDPIQIKDARTQPKDLLNLLRENGFNFSHVNPKKQIFEKSNLDYLIKNFVEKDQATNLLCFKGYIQDNDSKTIQK